MISEEMYDVMLHMIGYGNLTENFIDALVWCDHTTLLDLIHLCIDRWGTGCVDKEEWLDAMVLYNKENEE